MASENDGFSLEQEKLKTEVEYRELALVDVGESNHEKFTKSYCNLIAISNAYGYVFVGSSTGFKVLTSVDLLRNAKNKSGKFENMVADVTMRNTPHWIDLSADNLTLAVCSSGERGLQLMVFDTRCLINKQKPTKTQFSTLALSKEAGMEIASLQWNPNPAAEFTKLLAVCLKDGSFFLFSVEDGIKQIGFRPKDFGATSVCWSPKGKQMVVGKKDGMFHQLTHALEVKRSVPICPNIDGPVQVCNLLWLSTYQFAVAYLRAGEEKSTPFLYVAHVPEKNEQRETIWRSYEDPCYSDNEERLTHFYMNYLEKWNMFSLFSSNSMDSSLVARNIKSNVWEIWSLDDSCQAQLPIADDNEDSSPLGVAFMLTDTENILIDVAQEKSCPPMPVLVILTTEGKLMLYQLIVQLPNYPQITSPAQTLSLEGERKALGARGSSVSGESTNFSQKPANLLNKKLLSSGLATSTPKQPAFKTDMTPMVPPIPTEISIIQNPKSVAFGESFIEPSNQQSPAKTPLTRISDATVTPQPSAQSDEPVAKQQVPAPTNVFKFNTASAQAHVVPPKPKQVTVAPCSKPPIPTQPTTPVVVSQPMLQRTQPVVTKPKPKVSALSLELAEVINSFEKELCMFRDDITRDCPPDLVNKKLGSDKEMRSIRTDVYELQEFNKEIIKNTQEHHNELTDLSTAVAESLNAVQEAKTEELRQQSETYKSLLYNRPLNMNDQKKLSKIRDAYQYLRRNVQEANTALDLEWNKIQSKQGGGNKKLQGGKWEMAYQALVMNTKVRHKQEMNITLLSQQLDKLRLLKASALLQQRDMIRAEQLYSPMVTSPVPTRGTSLQQLADSLLLKEDKSHTLSPQKLQSPIQQKTSAKKMAQLAQVLSERKTTPVRKFTAARCRIRRLSNQISNESTSVKTVAEDDNIQTQNTTPKTITQTAYKQDEITAGSSVRGIHKEETKSKAFVTSLSATQHVDTNAKQTTGIFGANTAPNTMFSTAANTTKPFVEATKPNPISFTPQGSATLGYGAPQSLPTKTPVSRTKFMENLNEASSNLNNPPKVVNVKDLQTSALNSKSHIPPLPVKFENKGHVPDGAAEVVQKVLNTVNAEQQKQNTQFGIGDGEIIGSSNQMQKTVVTATITKPETTLTFDNTKDFDSTAVPILSGITNKLSLRSTSDKPAPTGSMFGGKSLFGVQPTPSSFNLSNSASGSLQKSSSLSGFGSLMSKNDSKPIDKKPSPFINSGPGFLNSASEQNIPKFLGNIPTPDSTASGLSTKSATPTEPSAESDGQRTPTENTNLLQQTAKIESQEDIDSTAVPLSNVTQLVNPFAATSSSKVQLPLLASAAGRLSKTDLSKISSTSAAEDTAVPSQTKPEVSTSAEPTQTSKESLATSSTFGTKSVFGVPAAFPTSEATTSKPASVFGTPGSKPSVFGASFASQSSPSIFASGFGALAAKASTTSTAATSAITTSASVEAVSTTSSTTTPVDKSVTTTTSAFGAATPTFGVPAGTSAVSASATTTTSSIFGTATSTGLATPTSPTTENNSTTVTTAFGTSSSTGFGAPVTSSTDKTAASVFGAVSASATSGFGALASSSADTSKTTSASVFGSGFSGGTGGFGALAASASDKTSTAFGTVVAPAFGMSTVASTTTTSASVFGQPASTGFGATATASAFGSPATAVSSQSVLGATSSVPQVGFGSFAISNTPTTGFGSLASTAQQGSTFGSSAFGSSAFGSKPSVFGAAPTFGQTSVFGAQSQQSATPAFGAVATSSQPTNAFGGGGFLSGLGGQPNKTAENKNPFALDGGGGQSQNNTFGGGNTSIFGQPSTANRGFGTSAFGQTQSQAPAFGGGSFSGGGGNVAQQGFGAFTKTTQPAGGFGSPPAFGAAANFGSPPAFGAQSTFGSPSAGAFGNTSFGASPSVGNPQSSGGFAQFANSPSGFGGFSSTGNTGFENTDNTPKGPSFSGWR